MKSSVLYRQQLQAELAIDHTIENTNRIEETLLSKRGSTSKTKIMIYLGASAAVILLCIISLIVLGNNVLGSLGDFSIWVLLTAVLSTSAFAGLQAAKIVLNRQYYENVFQGLELTKRVKQYLQTYKRSISQRNQELTAGAENGWNTDIKMGWDFQTELRNVENQISSAEKNQAEFLDKYAHIAYYAASFSVALTEVFLLQDPICNIMRDFLGNGAWIETVYVICALIAAIGGVLIGSYFWITCNQFKIGMISLLWIFADGLIGLLATLIVASLIILAVYIVIGIVKIVWEIVKIILGFIVGILILLGILSGS